MKRLVGPAMMASALIMLFLVVAQSGRHYAIVAEMKRLESVQSAWIEENRKLLSNIAVAASRARVDASMKSAEGYGRMGPANTLRIELVPKKERLDG